MYISMSCGVFVNSVGLKVPAVVAEVKAALSAGRCVVIGLQSTGEVICICFCLIGLLKNMIGYFYSD